MRFQLEHIFPDGVIQLRDTVTNFEVRVMTSKFQGRKCVAVTVYDDNQDYYSPYKNLDGQWFYIGEMHQEVIHSADNIDFLESAKSTWMHHLMMEP